MTQININGVTITLTEEQLKQIDEQRNKITSYDQIKTYADACKVLNIEVDDNLHPSLKLKNIAKAVNLLIDDNKDFPNWKDNDQYKYHPYFKLFLDGWSLGSVHCSYSFSGAMITYFKTEYSAKYIGGQFKDLYIQAIEEKY